MFAKERDKFGKIYVVDNTTEGQTIRLADLDLGDLFIFAGGLEILRLGEDGDDMNGGFVTAERLLTGDVVWTSVDYKSDCSGIYDIGRDTGPPLSEKSPRIVRVKEKDHEV